MVCGIDGSDIDRCSEEGCLRNNRYAIEYSKPSRRACQAYRFRSFFIFSLPVC